MRPWTDKYSPKKLRDVVGQRGAVGDILQFVSEFPNAKKKALLLHGPTGIGKTCAVKALAEEYNFELVELNASDFRDKATIENILGPAVKQASIFGTKKIILVDEVDGLSGTEDRGGATALVNVIKETKFPILITANDAYIKKLRALRTHSQLVELKPIDATSIIFKLKEICKTEGLNYDESALHKLAASVNGDLRAAINDLQVLSKERITEDVVNLWRREQEEKIFGVLRYIFKSFDINKTLEAARNTGEDTENLILWLDQNIPNEYYNKKSISDAYDSLSSADIFLSRIKKWQHWRFLVYANILSAIGVQQAKEIASRRFVAYQRPELLLKLFIRAAKRRKMRAVSDQISDKLHTSSLEIEKNFWPYYQFIVENSPETAEKIAGYLGI